VTSWQSRRESEIGGADEGFKGLTKISRTDARVMNKDVQTTQPGICKDTGLFLSMIRLIAGIEDSAF
jgi:hypothetical protein